MSAGRNKNSRSKERAAARKKARCEWFSHRAAVRARKRSAIP
jgi:hypothetical protein